MFLDAIGSPSNVEEYASMTRSANRERDMALRTWIAAGAAAAGLAVFAAGLPAAAQVHESTEQRIRDLEADLEARGFEVARGEWRLFEIEDCQFAMASMGFCMGNNPAAP
jgi:hypothetical protein